MYLSSEKNPWDLYHVFNHLRIQTICNNAVSNDTYPLMFVLNNYVRLPEMWLKDADDDEVITWCNAYKQCKAQEAQEEKEELMSIA